MFDPIVTKWHSYSLILKRKTLTNTNMKTIKLALVAIIFAFIGTAHAQTADEIISNYFENTGGEDAWKAIESMKMSGKAGMGPQEFPFVQNIMADGRMAISIDLQGQKLTVQAFDGEQMWGTNFQSMKAEAQDAETSSNFKKEAKNGIDTFLNYKEKGYTLDLQGSETVEGTDTFKIVVTKTPVMVDGKEEANVSTFYFDKENFVPILSESTIPSGPQKGSITQTVYSDYQEAGSIYYPHSVTVKFNGQVGQTIKIETIEINPEMDESIFKMPTQ